MAVLNGERMHDTMERLLPGARSAALLWQGAAVLGGAALGAGQVYGGAAPFGLALVIGCPPSYCLAAALGTLAAGLAFQPMLLGVKLAVAAVAAAAVRRLIDGRPGAGALAGCLTLTAAQVLQIVLAGGLFNPGQTVTVGCTALLAAVFGWAFAHFPAREPRGVCLWLAVATACLQRCAVGPLAPGLALAQLAGKLGQAGLPDPRREARVAQLFAELGLDALECSVTADLAGRLTANVTICRTRFTPDEVAGLTDEMTRICRRDMDTPEITHCRTVTMLCFGEKPLFTVEFGAAAHAAGGQSVSGDALDQFCDTSGRAQMLLCDGMGTGRAAAVDGQMAAKLTAQLLRAGFAAESAARLVNVALGLKGAEQESGATLDLLTVDLYTGRAGLFKAGAAPSFLVRGGVPRMLDGASLPMGVLDSLVGRSTTFALDAGDWVVLVSDGALTDGSDWLMQQLQLCAKLGHTPKQAAETVADAAARRAGAKQDDITVAVLAMGRA